MSNSFKAFNLSIGASAEMIDEDFGNPNTAAHIMTRQVTHAINVSISYEKGMVLHRYQRCPNTYANGRKVRKDASNLTISGLW